MHPPLKKFTISQFFGSNPKIYKKFGLLGHNGLDLVYPQNIDYSDIVFSVSDGEVVEVGNQGNKGYGIYIRINDYKNRYQYIYAHLSEVYPQIKDEVKSAQIIAVANNTGFSTGPHLHFGVRKITKNGKVLNYNNGYKGYIDPLSVFKDFMQKKIYAKIKDVNSRGEFEQTTEYFFGYRLDKDKDWQYWREKIWGDVITIFLNHQNSKRWLRFIRRCANSLNECIREKKKYKELYYNEKEKNQSLKTHLFEELKKFFKL